MERNLIILGSVTIAMRAKNILFAKGITSYVERHKEVKEYGCGYGLYVPNNAEQAVDILKENQIRIKFFVRRK